MNKLTLDWLVAALKRAIRTVAQTALGMITVGAAINDINWGYVLSVSAVAGIMSILTSIATNLPETSTQGVLKVDTSNPEKDIYQLQVNSPMEELSSKKTITFKVDSRK